MNLANVTSVVVIASVLASVIMAEMPHTSRTSPPQSLASLFDEIIDWNGSVDDSLFQYASEIDRRIKNGELNDDDITVFLHKCYDGDGRGEPGSRSWRMKYLWLLEDFWKHYPQHQFESNALRIPATVFFDIGPQYWHDGPGAWPPDVNLCGKLLVTLPWRASMGHHVRAVIDAKDHIPSEGCADSPIYVHVPCLKPGLQKLKVHIEIYKAEDKSWHLLQSRDHDISITVSDRPIKSVSAESDEISALIRNQMDVHLITMPIAKDVRSLSTRCMLEWKAPVDQLRKVLGDMTLGISIEVINCSGCVRMRAYYGLSKDDEIRFDRECIELRDDETIQSMKIRIQGVLWTAAAVWPSTATEDVLHYWAGSIVKDANSS